MKTISVATHKGGTGKTVTAMALASAFARVGKRILLVDLDPQGHSTLGLGIELSDNEPTLRDLLTETTTPIAKVIRTTHLEGLHLVPSNIRLERAAQVLYARPRREEVLRRALQPIARQYDYAIIDCPPSLSVLTESALAAADLILVPCQMEARAPDGLVDLLEVIGLIKGEKCSNWRILFTKVDSRRTVTNEAIRGALAAWQDKMLKTEVPQSEPLNQAQIQRTDIFTFDPKCKGATAYEALAQELMNGA